ncbi:rho GTPase activating protein at 54D isoform X3 [Rhodnius prolixus]|uniref:rho GTPase activating protein at 54D isoform X3 n=1 Tax=Rhodnius prolixus TaxID=13249 RepID=UPI003D187AF8
MSCDNSLSASESKKLAKKLRHEDPEQFQTLVRMHLSFVLDLHTEETDGPPEKGRGRQLKWGFVPFSKKIRGPAKDTVDGIPLTKEVISQIYILINFLTKEENLTQEGIFRRSGKMTRQQELKLLLTQGRMLNLEEGQYSVHDVASVLKSFLAELPEPVLTEAYYPAYCQIAELCQGEKGSKGRILRSLQLLLLLLPYENRRLLKTLLRLLHLTTSHVATNRMSAQNLATLFTPHLICPRKLSPEVFHSTAQNLSCIVAFMITEGVSVFEVPKELSTDIKAYWDRRRLTPNHFLERSISESTAANTVFSFVDRERTAQENVTNPTETALAQLYAHIQSLPESHKKKRLIKQFNKENGQGTPRTKSIGDSIKKHIFCKNVKVKSLHEIAQLKSGINCNDCVLKEAMITPRSRKPVVALSGSNLCHLGSSTWTTKDMSWGNSGESKQKESGEEESLTSPFRDYLFSRSVLTASPVDLSFSSRTGDYDPSTTGSDTDGPLSQSLMYFLDGGSPPSLQSSGSDFPPTRKIKRQHPKDVGPTNVKRSMIDSASDTSSLELAQNIGTITETSL